VYRLAIADWSNALRRYPFFDIWAVHSSTIKFNLNLVSSSTRQPERILVAGAGKYNLAPQGRNVRHFDSAILLSCQLQFLSQRAKYETLGADTNRQRTALCRTTETRNSTVSGHLGTVLKIPTISEPEFALPTGPVVAPQGHFYKRIMHLALPSRKSSNPPQYAPRSPRFPTIRRSRIQATVVGVLVVGSILWLAARLFGGGDGIPSGSPTVVILTVFDEVNYSKEYIKMIKDNRIEYAKKHGKLSHFLKLETGLNDPC
jgi:hypothetical protein